MYFCAVAFVAFLPLAYLVCQLLTFIVYEGRWRVICLAPILVVVAACMPLLYIQTPSAIVLVVSLAPVAGTIALACVWGLYSRTRPPQMAAGEEPGAGRDLDAGEA